MIEQVHHPSFRWPANSDAAIWRYMTAEKFEWMVDEGRLFMPSVARLGDPLEGTQPKGDLDWWCSLADRAISEKERHTIENNRQLISRFVAAFRTRYYVSCWHLNESINPEMWRLYADNPESVAVQTTFVKLRAALPAYIDIGMVRYIDYAVGRSPTFNIFEYITHKNQLYEPERELRAVAMHPVVDGFDQQHFRTNHFKTATNPAIRIFAPPIKVAALVEAVFIHPEAPGHYVKGVRFLCQEHRLPIPRRAEW